MRKAPGKTTIFGTIPVYCIQRKEAKYLANEVSDYLKYGISVSANDVVFDVGANIGIFSLWLHLKQNPNLKIYAFEPINKIAEVLLLNAQKYGPENITVIPAGLGQREEQISLTYYPKATVWSTRYPESAYKDRGNTKVATLSNLQKAPKIFRLIPTTVWSVLIDTVLNKVFNKKQTVTCNITTISTVINTRSISKIDLLKIDAEFAEWDVLQGIESQHWPLIKQVVLELHDVDDRLMRVKSLLHEKGFRNVMIEQQDILSDTNVYQVYASR